ncbi:MAG: hypothetical protein IKI31_04215 [Treponema sp.]|nr:hypothetical protein [Treponema sp.]
MTNTRGKHVANQSINQSIIGKFFIVIIFVASFSFLTMACNMTWNENLLAWIQSQKVEAKFNALGKYTVLPMGTNGTAGMSAQYVTFGKWPQTIKAEGVTVDESDTRECGMFTYCAGSDGEWYCKALENAYDSGENYKYSDDTVAEKKSKNSYRWFKVEPIKWRVLTESYTDANSDSGNKTLLFCERGIYAGVKFYDETDTRNIEKQTIFCSNYEHSRMRAWLNGLSFQLDTDTNSEHLNKGFLQTAFTDAERAKIASTVVDNTKGSYNDNDGTYACNNTVDKIFLLSYGEITNTEYGFTGADKYVGDGNGTTASTRIIDRTDFALANGANNLGGDDSNGHWFYLRSPSGAFVRSVKSGSGNAYNNIVNVTRYESGIIPALCITQ